ncbi:MAG: hypothetical protein ACE5QW_07610, partial [Thermoplasmata archaeon]
PVQSDGSFYAIVPLPLEGENNITFLLSDPAGNTITDYRIVTRDRTPPSLTLDSIPDRVTSNKIRIRGVTEIGSTVTLNGRFLKLESDGSFSTEITLSWGPNLIIVESTDRAGNVESIMNVVSYEGGLGALPWIVSIVLLIVGLAVGYFLRMRMAPEVEEIEEEELEEALKEIPEEEEVPPPEEVEEEIEEIEIPEEEVIEEMEVEEEPLEELELPAEEVEEVEEIEEPPIEEDPRLERLRKAYEEGRISKEVYEENLKRIEGE